MNMLSQHIEAIIAGVLGLVGVVVTRLLSRRNERTTADAAAHEAVAGGFTEFANAWREERQELKAELVKMHGVMRDMDQHLISLENILRAQGLDIPKRPNPHPILAANGD